MQTLVIVTLGAALCAGACGTSASDTGMALDQKPGAIAAAPVESRPLVGRAAAAQQTPAAAVTPAAIVYREITIPAGTSLSLRLTTAVASDTSHLEDPIGAELTGPVTIDGRQVVPAGATVSGVVTSVEDAGRVKGRARVALEFTSLHTGGARYEMRTEPFSQMAPATKGEDAMKIGIGAGAGAAIGALLGGKSGAAKGAAVGGGAGTGVVLATKGEAIRLAPGADVTTRLAAPLTVRASPR